jgi:hypothetical protein
MTAVHVGMVPVADDDLARFAPVKGFSRSYVGKKRRLRLEDWQLLLVPLGLKVLGGLAGGG